MKSKSGYKPVSYIFISLNIYSFSSSKHFILIRVLVDWSLSKECWAELHLGILVLPEHLQACFWKIRGNWRTWKKPMMIRKEYAEKLNTDSNLYPGVLRWPLHHLAIAYSVVDGFHTEPCNHLVNGNHRLPKGHWLLYLQEGVKGWSVHGHAMCS